MKGSRLYMIALLAFLVIVFVAELMAPHKFVWKQTYDKYDKEPLGSYVFDDVLSSSIDDYTVVNKTFYQIIQDDSLSGGRAFLLTEANPIFNNMDVEYLYKLLHSGNQVMICTENFPYRLKDTLRFKTSYVNYKVFDTKDFFKNKERDSIFFGTDTLNPVQIYEVFPQTHRLSMFIYQADDTLRQATDMDADDTHRQATRLDADDEPATDSIKNDPVNCDSMEVLVWDSSNMPLAVRCFIGEGELFLVSTPLMFTNFGLLDGTNASYVFRLLSFMKGKPLIRLEAYGQHDEKPQTPLRYVLSQTPLRWAIYVGMALLVLFMAFTAKRRQRIIPVVKPPHNRSLGFMQLISNLYYQQHDNYQMLQMKYRYFCADVKNLIGVELFEQVPGEADYERLFEKTGIEKEVVKSLLHHVRVATYQEKVNDQQLKSYIDGMNELLRALKN